MAVAVAARLPQPRPHTTLSRGHSKGATLPSPFGATRPGTVQSAASGYLPSVGTSRTSQHTPYTPFNPTLVVS
jgi:hypothetical protein